MRRVQGQVQGRVQGRVQGQSQQFFFHKKKVSVVFVRAGCRAMSSSDESDAFSCTVCHVRHLALCSNPPCQLVITSMLELPRVRVRESDSLPGLPVSYRAIWAGGLHLIARQPLPLLRKPPVLCLLFPQCRGSRCSVSGVLSTNGHQWCSDAKPCAGKDPGQEGAVCVGSCSAGRGRRIFQSRRRASESSAASANEQQGGKEI
jgi:hypothetical protein